MDRSSLPPTPDLSDPLPTDPPSSPLSVLTRSPTVSPRTSMTHPPCRLPSPPSSTICSGSASPMKSSDPAELEILVNPDGAPPPKRRRLETKPRTTEYLDLSVAASDQNGKDGELLAQLVTALRKKKKIVIIAGAGISVSAGIPDFRSSSGLFATLPKEHGLKGSGKHLFDASVYKHDATTEHFHTMVRDMSQLVKKAEPTAFHHLLASLSKEGRLLRLYTQNVDGLDTSMEPLRTVIPLQPKGPWPKTIQLHGGLERMVCSKCNEISQFDASLFEGPQAPLCKGCEETDNVRTSHAGKRSHGIGRLRPRMVLYNEYNPDEEAIANVFRADLRTRPDAVVVVGTSMKIPGVRNMVKDMCKVTKNLRNGLTAWINLDPEPSGTDLKNCWDLVVRGKCDDVASLVQLPRFDENIDQGVETIVDDAKYENDIRRVKLEVEIRSGLPRDSTADEKGMHEISPTEAKMPSLGRVQGIPTPSASPKMRTALPTKSASNPNQGTLTFPSRNKKTSSTQKASATKNTTQRKPTATKKVMSNPKATINTTFKATKSNVVAPTKVPTKQIPVKQIPVKQIPAKQIPAKRELDVGPTPLDNVRDILRDDFSLRPRAIKHPIALLERNDQPPAPQPRLNYLRPSTPEQQRRPMLSQDIVSPPSKPRGMGTLID